MSTKELDKELTQKLYRAFSPHAPIEQPDSFQGRMYERQRVTEAIVAPGLHVIVYGERGSGKTSLANVSTLGYKTIKVFCPEASNFAELCKDILNEFNEWANTLVFDAEANTVSRSGRSVNLDKLTMNDLTSLLPKDEEICIVLDELDRVEDSEVSKNVAELCKKLSTYQKNITMIMVGVAETADQLLKGHLSNVRNLKQVHLGKMGPEELRAILEHGEKILDLEFEPEVVTRIIDLCDGFPYYLHLIAVNSAKVSMLRSSSKVEMGDFTEALELAAEDCDESLRDVYSTAVLSVKASEVYRQILWAMADIPKRVVTTREIYESYCKIVADEGSRPVSIQAIGASIIKLLTIEKKEVISSKNPGFYGFTNPLMRGYIKMERAIDGLH